jgi:hypothetical protein
MEQFEYNIDDDIFKDLFPDGDYTSVINDIPFNNCKLHHSEFFFFISKDSFRFSIGR